MPTYKLTYFDIRGLAENARIIFAAAKQPYEDVRPGRRLVKWLRLVVGSVGLANGW